MVYTGTRIFVAILLSFQINAKPQIAQRNREMERENEGNDENKENRDSAVCRSGFMFLRARGVHGDHHGHLGELLLQLSRELHRVATIVLAERRWRLLWDCPLSLVDWWMQAPPCSMTFALCTENS